jgi:hypothetical protein
MRVAIGSWAMGLLVAAAWPGLAAGGEPSRGERILARVDHELTKADDQYFVYDLVTYEPGQPEPRVLRFEVTIKGTRRRRVEFLAPGDVRGMRYLILDIDRSYVYMPAYKKVRRVASHVRSQGFMGSAFSIEESSIVTYGDVYRAKLTGQDEEHWQLELTRRPGQSFPYPRLEMDVRRDVLQPGEIRYYGAEDRHLKTETRPAYDCRGKLCNSKVMTMIDHSRGDLKSSMIRREWKPNSGVRDSFFTVRALQRRR